MKVRAKKNACPETTVAPPPTPTRTGRSRRLFVVMAIGVGAILVATCIRLLLPEDRRPAIKNVADNPPATAPEILDLLREADKRLAGLVELNPENPQAWNLLAELHKRFGDQANSRAYWTYALQLKPDFLKARDSLGVLALENGDLPLAEQHFRMAHELAPSSSMICVQMAEVLINQGQIPAAIAVLEEDRRLHPNSVGTLALLGQSYLKDSQIEPARTCLEALIKIAPDYTNGYYSLSQVYAKLGQKDKALECLARFKDLKARDEASHRAGLKSHNDLLKIQLTISRLLVDVGTELIAMGDTASGEETVLRAVELDPTNVGAYQLLGWLYHRQGKPTKAYDMLAEAEKRGPNDLQNQLRVGRLYAAMSSFEDAERAFRRTIELTPHQGGGYAALAKLYMDANQKLPEALELARKATDREPSPDYLHLLAAVLERTGNSDESRQVASRANQIPARYQSSLSAGEDELMSY